jgi:hypothetical protein
MGGQGASSKQNEAGRRFALANLKRKDCRMIKGFSGPSADPQNPLAFATRFWDREKDAEALGALPHSDYLAPLLAAVLDHGILLAAVMPQCGGFLIPVGRQAIVLIDDSLSPGPMAFDETSIGQFLKRCESQAILVASRGAKRVAGFRAAAQTAVNNRESVLLINTTPEQHGAWRSLIWRLSPRLK